MEHIDDILRRVISRQGKPPPEAVSEEVPPGTQAPPPSRYDVDLAEFPLFRFFKPRLAKHSLREPLLYSDTIGGRDGARVERQWKLYPGSFGFGGASTHALLFDLLQIYVEQGCQGSQIYFGTLRQLFRRREKRNPSRADYARLRRDLKILCAYRFECRNAFWDRERKAYVDMEWSLFGAVFYFKEKPDDDQLQLPFGFIEVSPVLQEIARTRGFFALGFGSTFFHSLKPLEQRLAVYLARKFLSQEVHRRFVDDLARALPIEAGRPDNVRAILKRAAEGLAQREGGPLRAFKLEKSRRDRRWTAAFFRAKDFPRREVPLPKRAAEELAPGLAAVVDRMIEATGNAEDRLWWTRCARHLGQDGINRALGQLRETCELREVESRGAMLTKILKDVAREAGIALFDRPPAGTE